VFATPPLGRTTPTRQPLAFAANYFEMSWSLNGKFPMLADTAFGFGLPFCSFKLFPIALRN